MAQAELTDRRWHEPGENRSPSSFNDHAACNNHHRIAIWPALILLCGAATCAAGGSGPGFGVKVGAQTIDSPIDLDKTTRARYELEVASPRFGGGFFDLALTFGGSSLGSFSDQYVDVDDGVLIEEYFTDDLSLLDLRLVARLYPFGDSGPLQPYVGAGIGYFWFLDSWEYEYSETFEDPYVPGVFYTFTDSEDGRDTLAKGFFPFVTAGLMVPIGSNFELQFEFQYDFDKEDSGFDLGGPVYMFGCRLRF
jgi:hypothetical protein